MKPRYKKQCTRCKSFFLPDGTPGSRQGYCKNCRVRPGMCKLLFETGYQCQNKPEFFGYCLSHFLTLPLIKLKKEAKKI